MSDRIAVMNRGRVEQLDAPETLYRKPTNAFVARFIGDTNLLEGTVKAAGGGWLDLELELLGSAVRVPSQLDAAVGSRVHVSIRPEHVHLGDHTRQGPVRLHATIKDRSYIGANTRYAMDSSGTSVIALESNAQEGGRRDYRIGEQVTFGFNLEQAAVVSDMERNSPGEAAAPSQHPEAARHNN